MNQKNKHTLYLSDETWENIEKQIKADNFKSSSEFVEMAAIHYLAYLATENSVDFMPRYVNQMIDINLKIPVEKIAKLLFKFAVEQDIMMHIIASDTDIDDVTLGKLRNHCVKEVMESHADISFLNALRYQKEIVIDPNWE